MQSDWTISQFVGWLAEHELDALEPFRADLDGIGRTCSSRLGRADLWPAGAPVVVLVRALTQLARLSPDLPCGPQAEDAATTHVLSVVAAGVCRCTPRMPAANLS